MLQPLSVTDRSPAEKIYYQWYTGMFPFYDRAGAIRFSPTRPDYHITLPLDPVNPFIPTVPSASDPAVIFEHARRADLQFVAYMDWLDRLQAYYSSYYNPYA